MRTLIRAILVLALIVVVGFLAFSFWPAGFSLRPGTTAGPASPAGSAGTIDMQKARERGAELGEKAVLATQKLQETVTEAALTGKIKAKMALDDSLKARTIDVTTTGATVTLAGRVPSKAAHDRAVALARETDGVSAVIDHLEVAPGE